MYRQILVILAAMTVVATNVGIRPSWGGTISYELGISTDLNLLRDPTDTRNQLAATWKTSAEIAVARETPLFRLTNTSDDASITGLWIDLNDAGFVFDALVVADAPSGSSPTVSSPGDTVQGQATSPVLNFSFSDRPLRPHESFAFWVDLDPEAGGATRFLDYRDILWNRPEGNPDANSLVQVTFDSALVKSVPLFDFVTSNRTYDSLRAFGVEGQSYEFPLLHSSDTIGAFFLRQTIPVEQQSLTEPGGLVLAFTGLAIIGLWQRRRLAKSR